MRHGDSGEGGLGRDVEVTQTRERPALRLINGRSERTREGRRAEVAEYQLGTEVGRDERPYRLSAAARRRHLYVSGKPGTGKSELLRQLVRHDLATGVGCCLLDPHGGSIDEILSTANLTPTQRERIVVVDVCERERPVGIDLLHANDEDEQDMVVQFFLGLFQRLYLAEHQGPVFHQSARNALLLLMNTERSLAELPLVFTDKCYLDSRLDICTDPFVKRYFELVWKKMTDFHKSECLAYFTSKFGAFFEDRRLRVMLAQPQGGLDFDRAIADRQVVLVNLARGRIGDLNATLLGQIFLHLLRRSAMRRDLSTKLAPFYIYVDEAHELAGDELCQMLTALRKFAVGVVLANQSIEDFTPRIRDTILGSVGTIVAFRQGAASDLERFTQPRFDDRDLLSLPDHTAIVRTLNDVSFMPPQRVQLGKPPRLRGRDQAIEIRRASALRFGRPREAVESELLRAANGEVAS